MSIENYSGTIRISNPKTLQAWIDKGWYQEEIDRGYVFAYRCGRFKTEVCQCGKCRKVNGGMKLREVLERNKLLNPA